ncbi:hypothetical protein [Tessaracoccus sp. MC1679]|uniref:hypothetical protein n=1 Tax=Tessaracoccus sp. MC1679 TaxID=2760313 RepID=UPI00351C1464
MASPGTVLDIFEGALDKTPSRIAARGRKLDAADLAAVMAARTTTQETQHSRPDLAQQIWPLVSHHTYGDRALFGSQRHDILPRALTLLVLHDGLVVADRPGLTDEVVAACESVVAITQYGSTRSMNAGAAAAIAMYHWRCSTPGVSPSPASSFVATG